MAYPCNSYYDNGQWSYGTTPKRLREVVTLFSPHPYVIHTPIGPLPPTTSRLAPPRPHLAASAPGFSAAVCRFCRRRLAVLGVCPPPPSRAGSGGEGRRQQARGGVPPIACRPLGSRPISGAAAGHAEARAALSGAVLFRRPIAGNWSPAESVQTERPAVSDVCCREIGTDTGLTGRHSRHEAGQRDHNGDLNGTARRRSLILNA